MNSLKTATLRLANLASTKTGALGKRDFTRSLWHMTKKPAVGGDHVTVLNVHKPSINCTCGCNVHTKGEYLIMFSSFLLKRLTHVSTWLHNLKRVASDI